MLHVETRAIVLDEYFHLLIILATAAYLDFGPRSRLRELDGIGDQVHKDYPQHRAVAVTEWERANLPGNVASARVLRKLRNDLGDKLLQIYGNFFGLRASDSGKAQ